MAYVRRVPVDTFSVLAEPTRRRILDELRRRDSSVGELVATMAVGQPAVSKHLKVLRDAGFVEPRIDAQRRLYRLRPEPIMEIDAWLAPFRQFWAKHVDALVKHLDQMVEEPEPPAKKKKEKKK